MLSALEPSYRQINGMKIVDWKNRNSEGRNRPLQALSDLPCGLRRLVEMAGPDSINCPIPSIIYILIDDSIMVRIRAINNLNSCNRIGEERQIGIIYLLCP
jgi:hypothetical protein